jgi:hypothetical protein
MLNLTDSNEMLARLNSVQARGRVADTVLGVTLDVVAPFASEYLSSDEYRRLCLRIQATVDTATEAALATIAIELARVVEADPDLTRRLQRATTGTRIG